MPSSLASTRCARAITPNASFRPRRVNGPERRRIDEVVRRLARAAPVRPDAGAGPPTGSGTPPTAPSRRRCRAGPARRARQPPGGRAFPSAWHRRAIAHRGARCCHDRDPAVLDVEPSDVLALAPRTTRSRTKPVGGFRSSARRDRCRRNVGLVARAAHGVVRGRARGRAGRRPAGSRTRSRTAPWPAGRGGPSSPRSARRTRRSVVAASGASPWRRRCIGGCPPPRARR